MEEAEENEEMEVKAVVEGEWKVEEEEVKKGRGGQRGGGRELENVEEEEEKEGGEGRDVRCEM